MPKPVRKRDQSLPRLGELDTRTVDVNEDDLRVLHNRLEKATSSIVALHTEVAAVRNLLFQLLPEDDIPF
jgi:hypothetical protein